MPGRTLLHVAMMAAGKLPDVLIFSEIRYVWGAEELVS